MAFESEELLAKPNGREFMTKGTVRFEETLGTLESVTVIVIVPLKEFPGLPESTPLDGFMLNDRKDDPPLTFHE